MTPLLQDEGVEIIAIPQTMLGMSPGMKELEMLIRKHEMLHVHNTCARWCFGNVRCAVDGNENQKPMKNRSTGRIDITVAWIIAVAAWIVERNQKPDLAGGHAASGISPMRSEKMKRFAKALAKNASMLVMLARSSSGILGAGIIYLPAGLITGGVLAMAGAVLSMLGEEETT